MKAAELVIAIMLGIVGAIGLHWPNRTRQDYWFGIFFVFAAGVIVGRFL